MLPTIATGNVGSAIAGEYEVANSLRFNDGSSDFLHRMKSNSDEITTMTFSCWVKRCTFGSTQRIFSHMTASFVNFFYFRFNNDDKLAFASENTGSYNTNYKTNRVFRDASAWYHLVARIDTTTSGGNRIRIYVNGEQETSLASSTEPDQNSTFSIGTTSDPMVIGGLYGSGYGISSGSSSEHFDGYIAEAVMCEGQSLDPTSFGEFDEDTGIWKPKGVSGLSFGTNGFYLPFENSGALGQDDSGNGNNFTVNNLTSIDQSTDTRTNNFATMNPLVSVNSSNFSEGNLKINLATNDDTAFSSIAVSNGKWYWEEKRSTQGSRGYTGVCSFDVPEMGGNAGRDASSDFAYTDQNGVMNVSAGATSNSNTKGSALSSGDIICYAFDIDNGQLWTSVNGNVDISGTANATGLTTGKDYFYFFEDSGSGTTTIEINFGNPSFTISSGNSDGNGYGNFEYAVPSGYYALNTKNLAEYG